MPIASGGTFSSPPAADHPGDRHDQGHPGKRTTELLDLLYGSRDEESIIFEELDRLVRHYAANCRWCIPLSQPDGRPADCAACSKRNLPLPGLAFEAGSMKNAS